MKQHKGAKVEKRTKLVYQENKSHHRKSTVETIAAL